MVSILGKPKNKLKDFFDHSKKLVQPPKELPEIKPAKPEEPQIQVNSSIIPPKPPEKIPPTLKEALIQQQSPKKELKIPKIEHPLFQKPTQPIQVFPQRTPIVHEEEVKRFEEAISNINIDVIHNDAQPRHQSTEDSDYYKPSEIGEGYFSEIEHYIKNRDINEIMEDILQKDFLTSMKDYHDTKAQGKPFYLHKEDLKIKLSNKMERLRRMEEEWHSLKVQIEENEKKKKEIESEIEKQSQELKELFKQVRINQWMEQEALPEQCFKLINGQELKNLNDLRKALNYITDNEFYHHVNQERNDFATWVREALKNQELYEKIINTHTKEELQELLKKPF